MSKSIAPIVRQIVGKLHVGTPELEVIEHFWSKVRGKGADLPEAKRDDLEEQVLLCHRENVKMAGREALGFLGEG